jgi:hypothetical protein
MVKWQPREDSLQVVTMSYTIAAPSFASPTVEFIVALLGIAIGVISLVWARRFRVNPRMVYQTHDFFVVGQPDASSLGDIKIMFNDAAVPRVVVTQLGVWNAGNTTVRSTDIVTTDPPSVSIEGGALVLGSTRLNRTREVNGFHIRLAQEDRSRALLEFDYLDPRDGAVFQIIHTGAMNKAKVAGSIRGIPRGLEDWGDLQEWSEQKRRFSGLVPMLILLATGIAFSLIKDFVVSRYPATTKYFDWMFGAFGLLVGLVMISAIVFVIIHSFRAKSRATPKTLSRK